MSYPKSKVARAMSLGDQAPGYVFYLPGRQQMGQAIDFTYAGLSCLRKAGITEAQQWAKPGYISSVAGTNGYSYVTGSAIAVDWAAEVLMFSTRINMAAPGGNAAIAGTGLDPIPHGFYLSARTSGKILAAFTSSTGAANTGEVPGVILDGTEHAFGLVVDGPNKTVWCYVDGGLAFMMSEVTALGAVANPPTAFAIGAGYHAAGNVTAAASAQREIHMIKPPRLPLNVDELMLKMATSSGLIAATDMRFD